MFVEGILGCGSVDAAAVAVLPLQENIYEDAFWVALRNV